MLFRIDLGSRIISQETFLVIQAENGIRNCEGKVKFSQQSACEDENIKA